MRIRDIEIENFGLFSGHSLSFAADGFQLVFGPNEAGKSTLLQLIREVLFGFAERNPYAFANHNGAMAASAVVDLADGRTLRYRRRKGRTGVVVGEFEDGDKLDADRLSQLFGNANRDLYEHVFGFSLDELAQGQESLKRANVSEALFGGGMGNLANFQNVTQQICAQAEELFKAGATKRVIPMLLKRTRELEKEIRDARVKPRDYQKLRDNADAAAQRVAERRDARDTIQRQLAHVQRIAQALGPWIEQRHSEHELEAISIPDSFPANATSEYAELKTKHNNLQDF